MACLSVLDPIRVGSKKGKTQFNSDVGSLACYANKLAMSAEQQTLSEPISYTVFSL